MMAMIELRLFLVLYFLQRWPSGDARREILSGERIASRHHAVRIFAALKCPTPLLAAIIFLHA